MHVAEDEYCGDVTQGKRVSAGTLGRYQQRMLISFETAEVLQLCVFFGQRIE